MALTCFSLRRALRLTFVPFLAAAAIALVTATPVAQAAPSCTRYASTTGNDSSPGTAAAPFRTAQRLVSSLAAGEAGCLLGGTYVENVLFTSGGTSETTRKTLTTAPGSARATINGIIEASASGGNYVTLDNVRVDGRNATQAVLVQLLGDYGRLTNSEVDCAGENRIGITIGFSRRVTGVEVDHSRVHDCGVPGSGYDHGIYDDFSDGASIHHNVVYDNAGYGMQLWTTALNGKIYNNTFDGNGHGSLIVAGDHSQSDTASSNNDIYRNIFSNPGSGTNVVIFWGGYPTWSPGTGNVVHDNAYWNGALDPGSAYGARSGVAYTGNVSADPQYVDRAGKDFALSPGSALAGFGANADAAAASSSSDTPGTISPDPETGAAAETSAECDVTPRLGFWATDRAPVTDGSRPFLEALVCTPLPDH